ncbi:MAG: type IV pilus biogenesis/stability protein PilW [Candidatus Obscuribacterales bacterium]|nr:type IV pilus biogenesis/stability protein PilW [Steroidobacteraceae bacterium]
MHDAKMLRVKVLLTIVATSLLLSACGGSKTVLDQSQREQAATYNYQLGVDYFRQGNFAQAKEKLERSLEQDPRNAQTHMAAGLLYDRLGEQDNAESHFARAASLDPKNPELLNNYAVYLCRRGKYERGEKIALEAASDQLYKTPEAAWLNAGFCARDSGELKRAEQHFRRALAIQPRFAPVLLELADVQFRATQYLPARGFLERYSAAAPATPASLWWGVRIERALGNEAQAGDYARRLRSEFPNADETRQLREAEVARPKR